MRLIIKNSFYAMSLIACMIVGMLCASGCNVQTDSGTSDIDVSTYCNMIQIERIGFTGRGIVKKSAVREHPKSWIGRSQAA